MRKIIFIFLICIIAFLSIQNKTSSVKWEKRYAAFVLTDSLLSIVRENIFMELYFSDFKPVTNVHALNCGILRIIYPNTADISYSYDPIILSISIWYPDCNMFKTWSGSKSDVDEWLKQKKDKYNGYYLYTQYSFNDWLRRNVFWDSWNTYIEVLCIGRTMDEIPEIGINEALESMESIWGVIVIPPEGGNFQLVYKYSGTLFLNSCPNVGQSKKNEESTEIPDYADTTPMAFTYTLMEDENELWSELMSINFGQKPLSGVLELN